MPLAWLLGVPWADAFNVCQLLGEKVILNEFVAYQSFEQMVQQNKLSTRAQVIAVCIAFTCYK